VALSSVFLTIPLPSFARTDTNAVIPGATAAQIIPEILPVSQTLTVYQRSPNWVIPREDGPVPGWKRALYRYVPPVRWRKRAEMMDFRESFYSAVTDGQSAFADMLRSLCGDMMRRQIPSSPSLWAKLTPSYNPGCKRVIISDDYYPAIADAKTTLETEGIKRITATGIELNNGQHRDHDMLVLATGFRTVEFLFPMRITGTQGRELADEWAGGATALYGTVVPSLPNFGMYVSPPPLFFSSLLYSSDLAGGSEHEHKHTCMR
jgi:cation diffusion facilitator CzcD-associated flavoprotein CzcO